MDTAIIDAWEHRRVREDDDAYEGRINLGPPNDVAAAYEREVQGAEGLSAAAATTSGVPGRTRGGRPVKNLASGKWIHAQRLASIPASGIMCA